MIPLFNSTLAYGIRSTVHGLNITPLGISCGLLVRLDGGGLR
jgi:hypothetical protein